MVTTAYLIGVILFFIHSFAAMYLAKTYVDYERYPAFVRWGVCLFNALISPRVVLMLLENQVLGYVIISLIIILEVTFLFKDTLGGLVGVALSILIHFSASRSIILALDAYINGRTMYEIANNFDLLTSNTHYILIFHIILLILVILVIPVSAVKVIIKSKVFLPYMLTILAVLQLFFIFNVRIFTIDVANVELLVQQFILPCLLLGIFYVVLIFMIMLIKAGDYEQIIRDLETKNEIDELTGAYNKTTIKTKVTDYLNSGGSGALFVFDIDNFKSVNDYFGHAYGDELLLEIHDNIKKVVRKEDFVGRFGGDEFVVFIKECLDKEKLIQIATLICGSIKSSYVTNQGEEIVISASIGISRAPLDSKEYEELFRYADTALYTSKGKGKNTYTFYDKELKLF